MFTDRALAKHAGRFVWLAIDVEDVRNAQFLGRYPWEATPTFLVLDPTTGAVVSTWVGPVTVAQLVGRFDEAETALRRSGSPAVETALERGLRLRREGRSEAAVPPLEEALASGAPANVRPRLVAALVAALADVPGKGERCARLAAAEGPSMPRDPAFVMTAATGLGCALEADRAAPWRASALAETERLTEEGLSVEALLLDTRCVLLKLLVRARDDQGDEAGATRYALQLLDRLDGQAASTRDPEARAALDTFRVFAAKRIGTPLRALPALEASERELPRDFNPPFRIARIQLAAGRLDEALRAADRALRLAAGPVMVDILELRSSVLQALGDPLAARAALERALRTAEALPPEMGREALANRVRTALAAP